jgi:hypothetical protein
VITPPPPKVSAITTIAFGCQSTQVGEHVIIETLAGSPPEHCVVHAKHLTIKGDGDIYLEGKSQSLSIESSGKTYLSGFIASHAMKLSEDALVYHKSLIKAPASRTLVAMK